MDIVGAGVGREGDAGEDDFAAGVDEGGDDSVEVAARVGDGDAAKAVVAAKFDDDDGGVEAEEFRKRSTPSLLVLPLTPELTIL